MESKGETKGPFSSPAKEEKKETGRVLLDDIHCEHWLQEIGLEQYTETFLANFTNGGDYLSRKRLALLRIRHFPRMNITNYEHQKMLYEHISKVLEQEYIDKTKLAEERKAEEARARAKAKKEKELEEKKKLQRQKTLGNIKGIVVKKNPEKKSNRRKRYSFEDKAWEIINKTRGADHKGAYDHLKDSEQIHVDFMAKDKAPAKGKKPGRRRSFDGGDVNSAHDKALMFGNMAMEFDVMQKKMVTMQTQYLNEIKETVGCEKINMLFLNDKTRELMFCSDSKWYRVPAETGIAGYAIVTGETVNVSDAYSDYRFNSSVDLATNFVTKSILCQPIRGNRGGGRVVGVIEVLNKIGEESSFNDVDEDVLSNMTSQISDVLYVEFQELANMNDSLSAFCTPIHAHGQEKKKNRSYEQGTASSTAFSAKDQYRQLGAKKDLIDSHFTLGKNTTSEKEKGRARMNRRKSFGEELNAEIQANPELLHVRKD